MNPYFFFVAEIFLKGLELRLYHRALLNFVYESVLRKAEIPMSFASPKYHIVNDF